MNVGTPKNLYSWKRGAELRKQGWIHGKVGIFKKKIFFLLNDLPDAFTPSQNAII
jgi:hypothetical protein